MMSTRRLHVLALLLSPWWGSACAAKAASTTATPEIATPQPSANESEPSFPGAPFAEVRAFAFDLEVAERPICAGPLDPDGKLCKTVAQPGVVLSTAQVDALRALLAEPSTWGSGSACFLPHHGFVFYDAAGVAVAGISVCLLCDMVDATREIPGANRVDGRYGLSDAGTAAFRSLCNELGLPKCDAEAPSEFAP